MKARSLWVLACATLALAACNSDRGGASEDSATADSAAVGAPGDTASATATSPLPAAQENNQANQAAASQQQVPLEALGGSGITGNAALVPAGGGYQVILTLGGGRSGGAHAAHVHTGTCDNLGGVVAPLQPVTTDASGGGSSTSVVNVPPATLLNGQHVISVHEAGGNPGSPVACGAIPQQTV